MTAYVLFTPPTWRNTQMMTGSLRYSVPTSYCVYRRGGTWTSVLTAGEQDVSGFDIWVDPTDASVTLPLFFTGPTYVPDTIAAELSLAGFTGVAVGLLWIDIGGGVLEESSGTLTDPEGDGVLVLPQNDNGDGTVTV